MLVCNFFLVSLIKCNTVACIESVFFSLSRNFVESPWCLEEFSNAYYQVVEGRLNYIIVVLLEKPAPNKLPAELETYLTTHTYIDARKYDEEVEIIRKHIRFAMPKVPRKILLVRFISSI